MAPQTAISKAVCYKTKNEQLWEKAVHFLFVATNCFYAGLPTVFCIITRYIAYTEPIGDGDIHQTQTSDCESSFYLNGQVSVRKITTINVN